MHLCFAEGLSPLCKYLRLFGLLAFGLQQISLSYSFILLFLRTVTLSASSEEQPFTFTTCQNLLPQTPVSSVLLRQRVRINMLSAVSPVEKYAALWTTGLFCFISATDPDLNCPILFVKYHFITHRHTILRNYCTTDIFCSIKLYFTLIPWATKNSSIYT